MSVFISFGADPLLSVIENKNFLIWAIILDTKADIGTGTGWMKEMHDNIVEWTDLGIVEGKKEAQDRKCGRIVLVDPCNGDDT